MAKSLKDKYNYYHRQATYSEDKPKGCVLPWAWFIRQRQFSSGKNCNVKQKTITLLNVNKKWF